MAQFCWCPGPDDQDTWIKIRNIRGKSGKFGKKYKEKKRKKCRKSVKGQSEEKKLDFGRAARTAKKATEDKYRSTLQTARK